MARVHRHPTYWFDDGSVIVRVYAGQDRDQDQDSDVVLFRIHERLLNRHSRVILEPSSKAGEQKEEEEGCNGIPTVMIPPALGVQVNDFTSLLAHLYHDISLSAEAPFEHVASVLRASSQEQLDIPTVHALARSCLVTMFPSEPRPFVHRYPSGEGNRYLEEALGLSVRYDIVSIRKGIYYSIVTTMDFELCSDLVEGISAEGAQLASKTETLVALAPADLERCRNLMKGIVEHFTPVLFEPPVTPHMSCTNLLADKWFPLVVQGSIANDSVCMPLEALEQLKQIDWASEGLCMACVREKREEWTGEQEEMWEKMDGWLGVSEW